MSVDTLLVLYQAAQQPPPDTVQALIERWGPVLVAAVVTYTISYLANRGAREKARTDAQQIVNEGYVEIRKQLDEATRERLAFAEIRGGFAAQIEYLNAQLAEARTNSTANAERIALLEEKLMATERAQTELTKQMQRVIEERDKLQRQIDLKHTEAETTRLAMEQTINDLNTQIAALNEQLKAKDDEIEGIRAKLRGPKRKPITKSEDAP